jgi:hypothetical protein
MTFSPIPAKIVFFGLLLQLFTVGCNSHPDAKAGTDSAAIQQTESSKQKITPERGVLTMDLALQKKYDEACRHDTDSYDKKFISNFSNLVSKFNGKHLDTTFLSFGNIDGDGDQDTIVNRVWFDGDSVYVDSKWIKDHQILWKDRFSDPYTELNIEGTGDSVRNPWVVFAIGVLYGPPDFYPPFDNKIDSMVVSQGMENLANDGIHTDIESYKAYLQEFKGQTMNFGQPEGREGLWIWYKPAKRMINYYQP